MTSLVSNIIQTAGIAVGGALASRTSMWLSHKIEDLTGIHIGGVMSSVVPDSVTALLKRSADLINYPLTFTAEKIKNIYLISPYLSDTITNDEFGRRSMQLEALFKFVLAPVFEELAFRGGAQILGGIALERAGLPPQVAQGLSIAVSNTLFSLAHLESHEGFNTTNFSTVAVGGFSDAIICHKFGVISSIASHAISNLSSSWLKL